MKVLIVGGCATRAYVEFFQKCFPDWETRSALLVQVNEWVEEGNEPFLSYVESADIFVGLTNREPLKSLMPAGKLNVFLPSFDFFGYHPDSIFLLGISSPLELGVIHSRIAVSSFIAGLSESDAISLFNKDHFERLGYFDVFNTCRSEMFEKFDKHDIDLRQQFKCWSENGNFLYTVNHPHTTVFFDIACIAMKNHFTELLTDEVVATARKSVDDYMGEGLVWAMFPEVAANLGVAHSPEKWRTSAIREKEGKYLDLRDLVSRSFQIYSDHGEFSEKTINHLGGMDEILRYAGCEPSQLYGENQSVA